MILGEPRFVLERLASQDRSHFACAREPKLETYLRDDARAKRENDRNVSAVYFLLDTETENRIAGYFTLSNAVLIPSAVPSDIAKKLPRYDSWGCVKLGRMARDDSYKDVGLGPILVSHAFRQAVAISRLSGSFALIVDAKNDRLTQWYANLGFRPLYDRPYTLFMVNATMEAYLDRLADELAAHAPPSPIT